MLAIFFSLSSYAIAVETPVYRSDYVGQESRQIKSLSDDDIQQLQQGKGWGLAKAAELNGMPGPVHILQMKDKISLTKEQEAKIQALFEEMQSQAIPLGKQLIELEKELNDAFKNKTITEEKLAEQLEAISKVRKTLRYVHLVTHLKTPTILTSQQIELYNRLRGYGSADPCENIPEGHDAKMWRKHHDCN
jgi:Spy/CpxP family protein refolding chaperone